MTIQVTFAGQTFNIPERNERRWADLTDFLESLADNSQANNAQRQSVRQSALASESFSETDWFVVLNETANNPVSLSIASSLSEGTIMVVGDGGANASTNNITITPSEAGETIAGGASYTIQGDGNVVSFAKVGTDWQVFNQYVPGLFNAQGTPDQIVITDSDGNFDVVPGVPISRIATVPGDAYKAVQYDESGNVSAVSNRAMTIPVGTIAQRPGIPQSGMYRYNTDLGKLEFYNGSGWKLLNTSDVSGSSLTDLNDVVATSPSQGDILIYNSVSGVWESGEDEKFRKLRIKLFSGLF